MKDAVRITVIATGFERTGFTSIPSANPSRRMTDPLSRPSTAESGGMAPRDRNAGADRHYGQSTGAASGSQTPEQGVELFQRP